MDDVTRFGRGQVAGVPFSWRLGCRGHPGPVDAWRLLVEQAIRTDGHLLDASGLLGVPGRAALRSGGAEGVTILEPSAAGLHALEHDLEGEDLTLAGRVSVLAGLPWEAEPGAYDGVLLAPPAERGTARVHAELASAAQALKPDGVAWVLLDRDRGAKRYARDARTWFADVAVTSRAGTARLVRLASPIGAAPVDPWIEVADPRPLEGGPWFALPGTWSPDAVDPGTRLLLTALASHDVLAAGQRVLDLGCGWGPLTVAAQAAGAHVTAIDDDLAAVRSCARNAPTATVQHADVVHAADVDALSSRFDVVLVNPPFHVGKGVRMALGATFVRAALAATSSRGGAWIVANEALDYERVARGAGGDAREVIRRHRFKVLHLSPTTLER